MATEDLTTYTEVDPNSHISATSSRATGAGVGRDETCYLYKDYGENYFNGVTVNFDIRVTTFPSSGIMLVFGLSNTLNHIGVWGTSEPRVVFYNNAGIARLYFVGISSPYYGISLNTTYYCRLIRAAGSDTANLYIYSDSGRTTLLTTLTNTVVASTKWRYAFAMSSQNTGGVAYATSGYVENISMSLPSSLVHRPDRSSKGLMVR